MPLDLVDAGGTEIQPVKGAERDAESPAQHDLYRVNVTDDQDGLAAVIPQQPVTGPVHPACGVGEALPARRCLFGVAPPGGGGRGPSLLDFCQGEAFPVTESVSRRSSSMAVVTPSSPTAIAAVATARCNGELTTASIGAPLARRQAAALACRVPLALSGRSRSPLKRCSGDSWVSPCRSRTVVVGLLWGYPSPESYGCPRDGDDVVCSYHRTRKCQQNGSAAHRASVSSVRGIRRTPRDFPRLARPVIRRPRQLRPARGCHAPSGRTPRR